MRSAVILLALLATGGVAAAGPNLADRQRSLTEARRAGAVAQARADRLAVAASSITYRPYSSARSYQRGSLG